MKQREKVLVPARTEEHVTVLCDFCKERPGDSDTAFYSARAYVRMVVGHTYPECDASTTTLVDCCANCFESRVMPAIEALGVKFREEDTENAET
jgi:hypothetical protein